MNGSIFDEIPEDGEWVGEAPSQPSANGVCLTCGDPVEDCLCDEVLIQYEPMQTDDGIVDHTTPTRMACMDQSRYYNC